MIAGETDGAAPTGGGGGGAHGRTIPLEEGWEQEIKAKGLDKLEDMLDQGSLLVGASSASSSSSSSVAPAEAAAGGKGGEGKEAGAPALRTTKIFSNAEFVQVYSTVYSMCTQRAPYNHSAQLYERHGQSMRDYLERSVLPALREQHDDYLLRELGRRWENHKVMNKWMRRMFMYLDRYYVKYHSLPTLTESGLNLFRSVIYDRVKQDAAHALLDMVDGERDGETVAADLLKVTVDLFVIMGMGSMDRYVDDLETPLLKRTHDYYSRKSEEWIEADSTPTYLVKAERALNDEASRVQRYLHSMSEEKLVNAVEEELLGKRETELLEKEGSGCRALLANDSGDDLARMFRLFSRIELGLEPIAQIVREHITEIGNETVARRAARIEGGEKETNQDPVLIRELLALHDRFSATVTTHFSNHPLFQKALTDAFTEFINVNVGKFKIADLLGSFCDRLLRVGGEKLNEDQVEVTLDKVVAVFQYIVEKDTFANHYSNLMARRLLNKRSVGDDLERSMISKFKLKCGAQFTSKMEGMLTDLTLGQDTAAEFREWAKENKVDLGGRLEFSAQPLTASHWPSYRLFDITIPPSLNACLQAFEKFYVDKHNLRRLVWAHSLGTMTIRATYAARVYEFQVTTLQAIALLFFNQLPDPIGSPVSFDTLLNELGMPAEVLKRVLHSLACGRSKIVLKHPESNTIGEDHQFALNGAFSSAKRKFNIPMASVESTSNPKRVEEDRGFAIEAAIVRTMKARKTMNHQGLVAEVLSQLSLFKPSVKVIKRRIESLIDREYLARDEDQANVYKYV